MATPETSSVNPNLLQALLKNETGKALLFAITPETEEALAALPTDTLIATLVTAFLEATVKKRDFFSKMAPISLNRKTLSILSRNIPPDVQLSEEQKTNISRLGELMVRNGLRRGQLASFKHQLVKDGPMLNTTVLSLFIDALKPYEDVKYDFVGSGALMEAPNIPKEELPQRTNSINKALSTLSVHNDYEAHGLVWGTLADQITQLNGLVLAGVDTKSGVVNTSNLKTSDKGGSSGLGGGEFGPLDHGYFLLVGKKRQPFFQGVGLVVVADEVPETIFASLKKDYTGIIPLIRAKDFNDVSLPT